MDEIILSPAAGQRRCSGAVQVSAPSAGGPPVTVERHKLKKEVDQTFTLLNIQTFTLHLHFQTFTLSNIHTFKYQYEFTPVTTCMMLNILEGCGKPGQAAVAVERAEVQVKRDNTMPRQAAWAITCIKNTLTKGIEKQIQMQMQTWVNPADTGSPGSEGERATPLEDQPDRQLRQLDQEVRKGCHRWNCWHSPVARRRGRCSR